MKIVSTYRLQFHKQFTFRDAIAIVPYLHDLGITHVYASPYFKAVAGSKHGYDVIDQNQINPEIGTLQDYRDFVNTLADHQMSHILDIVPNHMGVETNENSRWNDVLASGPQSAYANFFDIDWSASSPRRELVGRVLLPVLGETLAEALDSKSLQLNGDKDAPFISYHQRRFPLRQGTDTQADLLEILNQQHYRLSYWKVGADEINYRRFFDIAGLAALQMHRREVFDEVHELTFQLLADGSIAGLRVDHPDGLQDPEEYFNRLQEKFKQHCPGRGKLYVAVEKILNGDEKLPPHWSVSGTSGYDFLCAINDLFIDQTNELAFTELSNRFAGESVTFADRVYQAKCAVLNIAMFSEMSALTDRLDDLAQSDLRSRDFTRRQLHDALLQVIACFGVYRSYVSWRGVADSDIAVVDAAVSEARSRNPLMSESAFDFIRDSVLLRYPVADVVRPRQLDFAQRFQQLTSPVNAKGIEDCTFYNYNRLVSLNEVGGDPGRFGRSCDAIHSYLIDRQTHWPSAMSSLSTHDTKRSEDVRARLNVLSEIPQQWAERLSRWQNLNVDLCRGMHANDQLLLYQTLLGAWPLESMDKTGRSDFIARIQAYMIKALRESRQRTSWSSPDPNYEVLVTDAVARLIDPQSGALFLAHFLPFQKQISELGMRNSLSQTVLRLTAPGVCDTYQGTELWDFSLVDPDNRRPVDYGKRESMLQNLPRIKIAESMEDGSIKLFVTQKLLHHRRNFPELFLDGTYSPLVCAGQNSKNLFAFSRSFQGHLLIVVVPRLVASAPQIGRWVDTSVSVPSHAGFTSLVNLFTGAAVSIDSHGDLSASELFRDFPMAVLVQTKN